ncbi:MAG: DeoR/GlpR transcriptional regulator [Coriobacteriaceae bacterium]|nr:DeoR/GlpR transcriptional regulator [Coriobacteriaceae bacterium]
MARRDSHPARSFAEERRSAILDMLSHETTVQVAELARTFGVSVVTARADLDALAEAGKLRRTHGGAISLQRTLTVSVQDRRVNLNAEAKHAIAATAVELVHDGDTLIVDSGTTALAFVRALEAKNDVTVITADMTIADYIDESMPGVSVMVLGGSLRKGHRYLYGPLTARSLELLHADAAFLCPGGFVPTRGLMTDFPQMAEVKQAMMRAAERNVVLMDASKVKAQSILRFAGIDKVSDIVMDRDPAGMVAAMIDELPEDRRPILHVARR